jgi:hypothetical protein
LKHGATKESTIAAINPKNTTNKMKKLLVLALGAGMFIGTTAHAQKQAGGEKNFQVLFAPLGNNPIDLNYGGISFRKFNATGTSAWRLNFFFGMNNTTEVIGQPDTTHVNGNSGSTKPELDKKTTGMTFSIRPGYEKHFAGTANLSPYWGIEAWYTMVTAKEETDHLTTNSSIANPTPTDWVVLTTTRKNDGAKSTFGAGLIAGFDYYFVKNLSLGAEFGFGFETTSMPDIEDESVVANSTTGVMEIKANDKEIQGSSMDVGPTVTAKFKLGWLF